MKKINDSIQVGTINQFWMALRGLELSLRLLFDDLLFTID